MSFFYLYVLQPFVTLLMGISAVLGFVQARVPHGAHIFLISDMLGNVGFKAFILFQFIVTPLVLILDKKVSKKFFAMVILLATNIFVLPYATTIIKNQVPDISDFRLSLIIYGTNGVFYLILIIIAFIFLNRKSFLFFFRYLFYSIYTLTWIPITIQGILRKNNKDWNPTKHVRSVEICDV